MRIVRLIGIAAGLALCGLAMVSGCQKDRETGRAASVVSTMDAPTVATQPEGESSPPTTAEEPQPQVVEPNNVGEPVNLSLAFSPGQTAVYKATLEARKSVGWIGPESAKPADFTDGRSGNHVEMTFEQRVERVLDNGDAVLGITIRGLKYHGEIQSRPVFEFDSDKVDDHANPLAALIGKSYRLEMSPQGKVVTLLDLESVRQAVKVGSPAHGVAAKLLSDEILRDQHEIPPLIAVKDSPVRPGQHWSDLKSFSFGSLGDKGFERVYTLRSSDGRTAVVEMTAVLSAAMAEEMHKRQTASLPPGLFDNTDQYEGRLEFDVGGGRVREYAEQMQTEWVIADPATLQDASAPPRGLKMGAVRVHRLELVE